MNVNDLVVIPESEDTWVIKAVRQVPYPYAEIVPVGGGDRKAVAMSRLRSAGQASWGADRL